uniref:Uncharacterized protein n=1 Tax=Triticum urartu TaxID=4572 RepID=A0A8R7UZZ9_TRIUA
MSDMAWELTLPSTSSGLAMSGNWSAPTTPGSVSDAASSMATWRGAPREPTRTVALSSETTSSMEPRSSRRPMAAGGSTTGTAGWAAEKASSCARHASS